MKDVPVILDLGHYALKGIVGDDESRRTFLRHGLMELGREDWNNVVESGGHQHPDYIQVGNRYFEIGQTALNHSLAPVVEGIERYRRNYYGALMCAVIARLFEPNEIQSAVVFASFPPGDRRHQDELEKSLLGRWYFTAQGRHFEVLVKRVVTYAEPMGGFWDFLLVPVDYGQEDNPLYNPKRQTLVIDLGGGTISMLPIGNEQMPDFRKAYSYPVGFNHVAEWFEMELRADYRSMFRGSRSLPDDLIHEALATGVFEGGGRELDVTDQVNKAMGELLDQIRAGFHRAGGAVSFGQLLLTGGGNIVLGKRLMFMLGHDRIYYAHPPYTAPSEDLAFANVTGGLKMFRELAEEIMS